MKIKWPNKDKLKQKKSILDWNFLNEYNNRSKQLKIVELFPADWVAAVENILLK